ncbi:aminoacyl-tRNA deacylase [Lysobacter silvisoli]|uniref:Deacylase n=1 Tax=Lysobacter silvisoli TaxID=2293254 RepID=A0A371K4B6_9GAMM|nr:YbaK/EbsC family protein [Lysobacter silvisoli]RDZ28728.1 deacylase [Lysobacter silvisoli]
MVSQRLHDYLDRHQVAYDTLAHPYAATAHAAASSADIDEHEMAKTVMVKLDGRLAMAVVPADEWLRLSRLRDVSGAQQVTLADEAEFKERFPECEVGAMPPFGNLYGLEVYAADSLADEPRIAFNAGTHRELMRMTWDDFQRMVHPHVAPLTRH